MAGNKISEDDKTLFRQSIKGTHRIKFESRIQAHKNRPAPRPLQRERDEQQVLVDMLSDPADPADMETGEELLFSRIGLSQKIFRRLRRGELAIESELDLHGLTKIEARMQVSTFLQECRARQTRCVRIIHGKGHGSASKRPILKQYVNHWLRQREDILAFCSARQVDGGGGAIYVLLRTKP